MRTAAGSRRLVVSCHQSVIKRQKKVLRTHQLQTKWLSVASVGGAAASSGAFGAQTYAVMLSFAGSVSSTGGCPIAIVDPGTTVSSTAGALLPANWIDVFRCSPGQRVSAISNDAGTFSLSITELTD
jgi:hypothetical protein